MKPSAFSRMNNFLCKPKDMSEHSCGRLPIYLGDNQVISLWKGSFLDRLRFLFDGEMWMIVKGKQQPPIALTTEYPWKD